jgi:hypothetical protein
MWLTKIFTAVLVALMGLLPSSCTTAKNPTAQQQQHVPVVNIVTASGTGSVTDKNLGELQLSNNHETCVSLGAGKSFTIKPTQIDRSHLQLIMQVESKFANGGTKDLSIVQVVTKTGQPFEIALGDVNLTLTPVLTNE